MDNLYFGVTDHTLFLTSPDYSPACHENLIRRTYRAVRLNLEYANDRSFFKPELMSHGKNNFTHFFPDVDMPDLVDGVDMRLIQFQPNLRTLPCSDRWKDWKDDELDMIPLYIRKGWKFQQFPNASWEPHAQLAG